MGKFSDEERRQIAKDMALYIIAENEKGNKVSTRSLSALFGVSNATVSDLMNRYLEHQYPNLFHQVRPIIKSNKPSVEDEEVKSRVLKEAKLVIEGHLVSSLSDDPAVLSKIYYDLNKLLPQIDQELFGKVKKCLEINSNINLKAGNPEYINQERDKSGRFKK